MTHITGHDRSQLLLLPEAVDDYVDGDNPVRFIDAFVDGLNLAGLGFVGTVAKATQTIEQELCFALTLRLFPLWTGLLAAIPLGLERLVLKRVATRTRNVGHSY